MPWTHSLSLRKAARGVRAAVIWLKGFGQLPYRFRQLKRPAEFGTQDHPFGSRFLPLGLGPKTLWILFECCLGKIHKVNKRRMKCSIWCLTLGILEFFSSAVEEVEVWSVSEREDISIFTEVLS